MSTFAFTGPAVVNGLHLERKHLIALAQEQGHAVHKHVTNNTDYLVCREEHPPNTVKFRCYLTLDNTHTLRISPERFLKKMNFL